MAAFCVWLFYDLLKGKLKCKMYLIELALKFVSFSKLPLTLLHFPVFTHGKLCKFSV